MSAPAVGGRRGDDRGQATVELALAFPLVVVMVLAVVQVALVGRDQVAVELAAREAARAASVSADPHDAAQAAARATTSLQPLQVSVRTAGQTVTVTVSYVNTTDAPLIGRALGDVTLTATATMHIEPPTSPVPVR